MVVVMQPEATTEQVDAVVGAVVAAGGEAFVSRGVSRTIVGLVGDIDVFRSLNLRSKPGVADVVRISSPYKLVSRAEPSADVDDLRRQAAGSHRARHVCSGSGPMRGRVTRADTGGRADGEGSRRLAASWRSLQAANLAVRVPGTRRGRAEDSRGRA